MKTKKQTSIYLGVALFLTSSKFLSAATILTSDVLSSSVSASGTWLTNAPINAFDDNAGTIWLSGSFPIAWIEVDLGAAVSISEGYFSVNMSPNGNANHQIWISDNPILSNTVGATLAHSFSASFGGQILTPTFSPVEGRYVQIRTTSSPSWVSWNEIELLGVPEPSSSLLTCLTAFCFLLRRKR